MVARSGRTTTTQEARSTSPVEAAIAGSAVATMVWSTTARNIGSMIDGKTVKNGGCCGSAGPTGLSLVVGPALQSIDPGLA